MKKVNQIDILGKIEEVSNINLLRVKDYSTYQDIVTGDYLKINNNYGNKLYKGIGLRSYNYMRILDEIDSRIATGLIITRMNRNLYKIYRRGDELLILLQDFKERLRILEDELNNKRDYTEKYEYRDNKGIKISYLVSGSDRGFYIEIDLEREEIKVYRLEWKSGYFLLDKYSEGGLGYEEGANGLEMYYKGIESREYSYEELERINKELGIGVLEEEIKEMNRYRKKVEFSGYRVIELYRWIGEHLGDIDIFISRYYDEVEGNRLVYDLREED